MLRDVGLCNRVPTANVPGFVQTLVFSRSYLHRQVSPPETLVVKEMAGNLDRKLRLPLSGSFTCCKYATWDKRLYFPSEGRRAEDFFRPEKSNDFGRV